MARRKKPSGLRKIIPVKYRILEKVFLEFGYKPDHQRGSHKIYLKDGMPPEIVIPIHSKKEVPVGIIMDNINRTGISREEFLEVLKKFI